MSVASHLGCGDQMLGSFMGGLLGDGGGGGLTVLPTAFPVRIGEQRQFRVAEAGGASSGDVISWQSSGSAGTITPDGLFTATGMGTSTVWATYRIPATDEGGSPGIGTTNRVTFDVWPGGPGSGQ
jgi:hypothetical protein